MCLGDYGQYVSLIIDGVAPQPDNLLTYYYFSCFFSNKKKYIYFGSISQSIKYNIKKVLKVFIILDFLIVLQHKKIKYSFFVNVPHIV